MRATNVPHCMAGRQAVTATRENNPTAVVMHNLRLLQRQLQIVLLECFHANQTGYSGFTYISSKVRNSHSNTIYELNYQFLVSINHNN